jgi:hypothetical protein
MPNLPYKPNKEPNNGHHTQEAQPTQTKQTTTQTTTQQLNTKKSQPHTKKVQHPKKLFQVSKKIFGGKINQRPKNSNPIGFDRPWASARSRVIHRLWITCG